MAFPTTSILDSFNRADEGPPPSASWYSTNWPPIEFSLQVIDNQCAIYDTVSPNKHGDSAWNTLVGPDCEAYVDIINSTGSFSVSLWIRVQDKDTKTLGAYLVTCGPSSMELAKWSSGYTALASTASITISDGDSFGISAIGTALKAYHKPAAGSWTEILSATDSAISAAGYIFLRAVASISDGTRFDNFGGGTIPVAPTADFSGTPTSGAASLPVDFTDLSTGTPTSWAWTFGDGGTSTSQNPSHTYTHIGVYTVALTATNDEGSDTETKIGYITVVDPPTDPTNLQATAVAYNQIDLRWVDNASDEDGFSIERSADGLTGWVEIDTVAADVVEYSDTTVGANETWYYRVRGFVIA